MTRHDDIDRVLEEWLAEGPSRMSDRLVTATLDQLDHTPQPRFRLPWRPTMNRLVVYAAGLTAVLVVSVAAWSALGGRGGFGGQPTPTPTASASASVRAELVGTWVGTSPSQEGQATMILRDDGTSTTSLDVGTATWAATDTDITFHYPAESTWCPNGTAVWRWEVSGDRLRLDPSTGGACAVYVWVYNRQPSR